MALKITIELDREQFHAVVSKLNLIIELLVDKALDTGEAAKLTALTEKLKTSETTLRAVVTQDQPPTQL